MTGRKHGVVLGANLSRCHCSGGKFTIEMCSYLGTETVVVVGDIPFSFRFLSLFGEYIQNQHSVCAPGELNTTYIPE